MLAIQSHQQSDRISLPDESCLAKICSTISAVVLFPFRCLGAFFAWLLRPIIGFFLQVSVYRLMAVGQGGLTACCCDPILRAIFNIWSCTRGGTMRMSSIDPARLTRSEEFITQFAEFQTLKTADGHQIRFALYRPEAFTQWIEKIGGVREGDLIRPKTAADWETLQALDQFRWFEQEGQAFRVPAAVPSLGSKCILRCQGFGRSIPMDKSFIGAHMALGIPYAVFDWRAGDLTSTGFFEDAETAYQAVLQAGFHPSAIVPMGSCRATFIVGKLKETHHAEGLSAVMIQPPPSLEQVIRKQNCIASFLGMIALPTVETMPGDYDTVARLKSLAPSDQAKLCVILSENDQTLPADTEEQFRSATAASGGLQLVMQKVASDADAHLQEPLKDPIVFQQYVDFLKNIY